MKKFQLIFLCILMIALYGCSKKEEPEEIVIMVEPMDDYNAAMIGKKLEILVEGYDEEFEQYFGRTYADSPDIDGRVWLACDEPLTEGTFVNVCIDSCIDGDLAGYVLEDE